MISLDFILSYVAIFAAAVLISGLLYETQLKLETKDVADEKFSDICNILYITNFGIELDTSVGEKNQWCLSPKTQYLDFAYVVRWYELLN